MPTVPTLRTAVPIVALACLWVAATADGQEKPQKKVEHPCDGEVWCGLFVARAGDPIEPPGPEIAVIIEKMAKAFPEMGAFQLLGENSQSVFKEYECWIVPSKQLFLKLDSLGVHPVKGGIHLHLQLWQQDHVLLKSDAILRRGPVIIAGPDWGDGRIIMVLRLATEEPE